MTRSASTGADGTRPGAPAGAGSTSRFIAEHAPSASGASHADEVLVKKTLAGDERAFGRLVERYQGLLMLIAFRRSWRGADCEDVVQEAFVRAFRALATLERPERFRSWLCRICSNVALDCVRRRSPVASFDQDSGLMRALPPEGGRAPPARAEVDEERDRLIAAIERLPETYQVPVVLRHVEGLSYRDIAKRLGIREDALRKRIHRANEMLRNELSRRARGARSDRKDNDGG
ncbi:MAG: RNA polymerase sigma factor [Planctomycetota bacterium]|jgi:RNA polymerase sigma-70 factor (ECF subfamily)